MNSTSTPSMVELHSCSSTTTSPPPLLQPPPPSLAPTPPPTSSGDPVTSPSPLLRDVGSVNIITAPSQARVLPQPPLPFPKGCGRLKLTRRRIRRGRKTREGPMKWGARVMGYEIRATTIVVVCFRHPSGDTTRTTITATATMVATTAMTIPATATTIPATATTITATATKITTTATAMKITTTGEFGGRNNGEDGESDEDQRRKEETRRRGGGGRYEEIGRAHV